MASISDVVKRYQEMFSENLTLKCIRNKQTLGPEGVGNMTFYMGYMFQNQAKFLDFLKETGLLKTVFICHKCNEFMKLRCRSNALDLQRYVWKCKKSCGISRSIRFGSIFSCSRLTIEEIFILCYELVKGKTHKRLIKEYSFSSITLSTWRQLINTVILDYVLVKSEVIGGRGITVDLVETRVHKRSYQEELNVIAGIERGSGRFFFVSVHNKSAETYQFVIEKWIEKGTAICSASWDAPDNDIQLSCDYLRAMHDVSFLDPTTDGPVKPTKNQESNDHGAFYVFKKSCVEKKENVFNAFLEIAREVDWVDSKYNLRIARLPKEVVLESESDQELPTPD